MILSLTLSAEAIKATPKLLLDNNQKVQRREKELIEEAMNTTLHLVYDGEVFRPEEPVELRPDTRVRVTIETIEPASSAPRSFLQTAKGLRLKGPPDWSERLEEYLYGELGDANE